MTNGTIEILLVEDSPTDQLLAKSALGEIPFVSRVHVVNDGVEALAFLRGRTPFENARRPDLVLLDLNLPRKDGRDVLGELKTDPTLCTIPVVVLTTSGSDDDVENAYRLHANCYVVKPIDFDEFRRVVRSVCDFWFQCVRLPKPR